MSEEVSQVEEPVQTNRRVRRRATWIFLVVLVICAAVVVPPLISVNQYQRQITALMTRSLGRPVHLSSVNLHLLPRPGFILNNLTVGEAQEFGTEPILTAETVVASIRLSALLTGKVEIDRVSLDNASLNLAQSMPGRWNVEQFMMGGLVQGMTRTAPTSSRTVFGRRPAAFPYLEAKNSRVNVKRGLEKLPYSLTNAQLSFWQESTGVWRLRLRGQPARTDMEISTADTGDLRLEATLQTLPGHDLYQMPLKIQAAWREAQLGQLSRLLVGSDQGWRGDLTADLNVQGTADEAQTEVRLRATSVRREEFVPASPMDFDIHCGLLYRHTRRAARNLDCNTLVGGGKLELKGDLPGDDGPPQGALTVDGLPLQAGLDMLRTVRQSFAPSLSADGKISGALQLAVPTAAPGKPAKSLKHPPVTQPANAPVLQGQLTIIDGALKGKALKQPLTLPKITLAAAQIAGNGGAPVPALATRFSLPLTQPAPAKPETASTAHAQAVNVRLQLSATGYQAGLDGSAPPERLRELAYAFGLDHSPSLDAIQGGQTEMSGIASGPWLGMDSGGASSESSSENSAPSHPDGTPLSAQTALAHAGAARPVIPKPLPAATPLPAPGVSDQFTGVMQLHHAAWSAPYLARAVDLPEASLNIADKKSFAAGTFAYGALAGSFYADGLAACPGCTPQLEIHLDETDAATIEGALLGAPEKKSMLSPLIDRVRNAQHIPWPEAQVQFAAESLALGPVTLHQAFLAMKITRNELTLERWHVNLLGGDAQGTGSCTWNGKQLAYTFEGNFSKLSGSELGQLLDHPVTARPAPEAASDEKAGSDAEPKTAGEAKSAESNDAASQANTAASPELWAGGPVDGSGKVELGGLTAKELASTASGTLHFHWANGSIPVALSSSGHAENAAGAADAPGRPAKSAPAALHFSSWTGDANLGSGKITLGNNSLAGMPHEKAPNSVAGSIPFGGPAQLTRAQKAAQAQPAARP